MQKIYAGGMALIAGVGLVALALGPVRLECSVFSRVLVFSTFAVGASELLLWLLDRGRESINPWLADLSRSVACTLRSLALCAMPLTLISATSAVFTPFTGELADGLLAAPEELLGIRQVDARSLAESLGVMPVLTLVYCSIWPQGLMLCLFWGCRRRPEIVLEAATALVVSAAFGLPLYLILPSAGPSVYYGWAGAAPSFLDSWFAMRAWEPVVLTRLEGYIGAPSYHVVFALLFVRGWWDSPFRLPALGLNGAMLVATWIVGWHYLTDLSLGAVVGGGALLFVRAWEAPGVGPTSADTSRGRS